MVNLARQTAIFISAHWCNISKQYSAQSAVPVAPPAGCTRGTAAAVCCARACRPAPSAQHAPTPCAAAVRRSTGPSGPGGAVHCVLIRARGAPPAGPGGGWRAPWRAGCPPRATQPPHPSPPGRPPPLHLAPAAEGKTASELIRVHAGRVLPAHTLTAAGCIRCGPGRGRHGARAGVHGRAGAACRCWGCAMACARGAGRTGVPGGGPCGGRLHREKWKKK